MRNPQWTVRGLVVVLVAALVPAVVIPGVAAAAGPSVGLPSIASTPVSQPGTQSRQPDPASVNALHGNQAERGAQDGAGSYQATSLSPSTTWDVSAQTGDFSTSYPLRVPPAPGGLVPSLALNYRSSTVDGRTSVTNNQPSWIGDGWDLSPGFVERAYGTCADDAEGGTVPPKTGDLCWRSDNAAASYSGGGGVLIKDDATGVWHPKNDDGSRVERLGSPGDGESWKITSVDGTQYYFGSEADSKSAWTVPVYGDDAGEPCHHATFETSRCALRWRWNLDKVIDRNGNEVRYFYEPQTNSYGANLKDAPVSYLRGGSLVRAEYGLNTGVDAPASGRVLFALAGRCVPGSDCSRSNKGNWPDTPLDQECTGSSCAKHSPSFWSDKRLASITTQVRSGANWSDVDRWDLDQQYPDPGDGQRAALWLKGIRHTGLAGGSLELPSVTFEGNQFANRVLKADGISGLNRYRLTGIVSETGGVTSVTYAPPECKAGGPLPASPETNTLRCFPVRWARPNEQERTDYFHKYVVAQVVQSDRLSSSTEQVTSYEYLDGAAWHWDMSEFAKDDKKTWNEFRGFGRVRVRSGVGTDPSGPVTLTEATFYRGMNGDRLPNNGTRSVSVTDSEGGSHPDEDQLSGFGLESTTFDGSAVVSKTISDPVWRGPTATRGAFKAYFVGTGTQRQFTALAAGGWRTTTTETTYDELGLPVTLNDLGDTATAADDRCTTTTYRRDSGTWLMNLAATSETVAVACGTTPTFPRDAISATRTSYDGNGNLTRSELAKDRPADAPSYVTTATATFDAYGRVRTATNADGKTTATAYTPTTGGPVTSTTVTSPPTANLPGGLVSTTDLETSFGQPVLITDPNNRHVELAYDPLGRLTKVWLANRDPQQDPSLSFTYLIRNDAPTVIGTSRLGPNGRYLTSNLIYDGLLRPRQAQTPAVGGGRLLTDTRYDSQGRSYQQTQPFFNDAAVDDKLWVASDTDVPALTRTEFDGAGRPKASVFVAYATEKWRSTTAYGGDRVTATPPAGGIPSTTITDARGQVTELRRYLTGTAGGAYESTRFGYSPAGNLTQVTGPGGVSWRYGFDLRGRPTSTEDPDSGRTTASYNDLSQVVSTQDARGKALFHAYDALGRPTETRTGSATGPLLATQTYDTAAGGKGRPATSTSYANGNAYTSAVGIYSSLYQPVETSVTIPAAEGLLAGTYTSTASYAWDGSLSGMTYPAAGGLPEETVNYVLDDAGRPLSSSGGLDATVELVTGVDYTRYGEQQRVQLGAGTKRTWLSYLYEDSTRRLARSIVDTETTAPMRADVNYAYDPAGNITSITDKPAGQAADTQCFRRDPLRRLTEAWTPSGACAVDPSAAALAGPAPYWQSYAYDSTGNRVSETTHATAGDTVRTYGYANPTDPQPHALRSVSTNGTGTESYTYDASGNTLGRTRSGVAQALAWDALGRLDSVTKGGATTSYVYGPDGGRLLRKDPTGTTLYLGGQEVRLAASGGSPVATRYYTFGGTAIAVRQGNRLTWLAGDHQGTATVNVDAGALSVNQRRQLPFGAPRGASPTFWPDDHGFVGGTQDSSTGLTHLGAREYDPATGRFISVDPVQDLADPQQWNGYAYSDNDPVTGSDPSGLWFNNNAPDGECDRGCPYKPGQGPASKVGNTNSSSHSTGGTYRNSPYYRQPGVDPKKYTPPQHAAPPPPPPPKQTCLSSTGYGAGPCPANDPCPPGKAFVNGGYAGGPGGCVTPAQGPTNDDTHGVLDICGSSEIPVLSQLCDGLNALSYAADGQWGDAAISVAGLIPVAGDVATAARLESKSEARAEREATHVCSFAGATEVLLADGTAKPLDEITVGDRVLATDPLTGKQSPRAVTAVLVHEDTVVDLATDRGGTVTTTANHRFYDATDQKWERADQLHAGDRLLTADGADTRVVGLLPASEHIALAYNLTVDEVHTYHVLVGSAAVLVHNDCTRSTSFTEGPLPDYVVARVDYYKETGNSPAGMGGLTRYRNDGRENSMVLPRQDPAGNDIKYKEGFVQPRPGPGDPGTKERVVFGNDGSVYYTPDHYQNFLIVRPGGMITGNRRGGRRSCAGNRIRRRRRWLRGLVTTNVGGVAR